MADKIKFASELFEKEIKVGTVFNVGQQIDTIGLTHGRGFEGVITRWGVTRLPRKTRAGNRKVACIGGWHPANIKYTVARAGQMGYFHRTEQNRIIMMINNASNKACCRTEFDTTDKGINPVGGWVSYGLIKSDFVMIQGSCAGTKKRTVVLREALFPKRNIHPIQMQWICTASKLGHGMFETVDEKKKYYAQAAKQVAAK